MKITNKKYKSFVSLIKSEFKALTEYKMKTGIITEKIRNEEIVKNIKKVIIECLNETETSVKNIILFGSRARSDFEKESDFDLLIILNKEVTPKEKKEIWYLIYSTLHKSFHNMSFDIILRSAQSFEDEKNVVNTISNEVFLEGIEI